MCWGVGGGRVSAGPKPATSLRPRPRLKGWPLEALLLLRYCQGQAGPQMDMPSEPPPTGVVVLLAGAGLAPPPLLSPPSPPPPASGVPASPPLLGVGLSAAVQYCEHSWVMREVSPGGMEVPLGRLLGSPCTGGERGT